MRQLRMVALAGLMFSATATMAAEKIDADKAQSEMQNRITKAVNQFVEKLGASSDVEWYCRLELNRVTSTYPSNGLIPFGVNYGGISTQQHLDMVINAREMYETVSIKLCIARAMRDLSGG
jgi:hypothetical protein